MEGWSSSSPDSSADGAYLSRLFAFFSEEVVRH
jgi:hypothetical protein